MILLIQEVQDILAFQDEAFYIYPYVETFPDLVLAFLDVVGILGEDILAFLGVHWVDLQVVVGFQKLV